MDPLAQLVSGLDRHGKPSLHWVVRWSDGKTEPVAAAWRRTRSPEAMVRVLDGVRHPLAAAARRVLEVVFISNDTDRDLVRCNAIRRLIPTPPTLQRLIEAASGTSGGRISMVLGTV